MHSVSLTADDLVFSVATHPTDPQLAVGSISGRVAAYTTSEREGELSELFSLQRGKGCRSLCYSPTGEVLYSASKDKCLYALNSENGKEISRAISTIKSPVSVMLYLSGRLICGHDNGAVSVYEAENLEVAGSLDLTEGEEYISGICHTPSGRQVVVSTGEGQLALIDTREIAVKKKFYCKYELLCVCCVEGERKCIAGDTEGKLHFFTWLDCPLHPYAHLNCVSETSLDCCVSLPQSALVCVGCGDGVVRIVNSLSLQVTGVVGRRQRMHVESLVVASGLGMLCCSAGDKVMMWKVSEILSGVDEIERKRNNTEIDGDVEIKRSKVDAERETEQAVNSEPAKECTVVRGLRKGKKKQKARHFESRSKRAQFFDGLL